MGSNLISYEDAVSAKPPADGELVSYDEAVSGKAGSATAADYLRGAGAGANQLLSGIGSLAGMAGANRVGKALREAGDVGQKYWMDAMTPAGRKAAQTPIFEDDPDSVIPKLGDTPVQSALMSAAQSLPSTAAMAIPGGIGANLLTRGAAGLAARGIGGETMALAGGAIPATTFGGRVAAAAPSALGMGASEGVTSAAMNAAQLKSEIEQAPQDQLDRHPAYQELRKTLGADEARARLADMAERDVFGRTALSTGLIGMATGGGALGGAYRTAKSTAKTPLWKEIAKQTGNEAFQEAAQSGPEQLIENLAKRDYLDPNQRPMAEVIPAALSGGVTGGLMGGIMGGAGKVAQAVADRNAGDRNGQEDPAVPAQDEIPGTVPAPAPAVAPAGIDPNAGPLQKALSTLPGQPAGSAIVPPAAAVSTIEDATQQAPMTQGVPAFAVAPAQNTPVAPVVPVAPAAPITNQQAESAGATPTRQEPRNAIETQVAQPAAAGRQEKPAKVSTPAEDIAELQAAATRHRVAADSVSGRSRDRLLKLAAQLENAAADIAVKTSGQTEVPAASGSAGKTGDSGMSPKSVSGTSGAYQKIAAGLQTPPQPTTGGTALQQGTTAMPAGKYGIAAAGARPKVKPDEPVGEPGSALHALTRSSLGRIAASSVTEDDPFEYEKIHLLAMAEISRRQQLGMDTDYLRSDDLEKTGWSATRLIEDLQRQTKANPRPFVTPTLTTKDQPKTVGRPIPQTPTEMPIGRFGVAAQKPAIQEEKPSTMRYAGMTAEEAAKLASKHGYDYHESLRKIVARPGAWVQQLSNWKEADKAEAAAKRRAARDEKWRPNESQQHVLKVVNDTGGRFSKGSVVDQDIPMFAKYKRSTLALIAKGRLTRVDLGDYVQYSIPGEYKKQAAATPNVSSDISPDTKSSQQPISSAVQPDIGTDISAEQQARRAKIESLRQRLQAAKPGIAARREKLNDLRSRLVSSIGSRMLFQAPQQPTTLGAPLEQTPTQMPVGKYGVAAQVQPAIGKDVAAAQHIEGKSAEPATPAVIKEAIKKGAENSGVDLRKEHAALLQQIDAAIAEAPSQWDTEKAPYISIRVTKDLTDAVPNSKAHLIEYKGRVAKDLNGKVPPLFEKMLDDAISEAPDVEKPFVTFSVPGDGKFKVTNTKERLQLFRKKIVANAGAFRPPTKRSPHKSPLQQKPGGGTADDSTIIEMLQDGELTAALELSKVVGRPLVFGNPSDGVVPSVKTHSEPVVIDGFEGLQLSVGRNLPEKKGSSGLWSVTEMQTGWMIGKEETTRKQAIANAEKELSRFGVDTAKKAIANKLKSGDGASQEKLEAIWLKWAEEEEKRIDNKEGIQARADKERADKAKAAVDKWKELTGIDVAGDPSRSLSADAAMAGYVAANKLGNGERFLDYVESAIDGKDGWHANLIRSRIKLLREFIGNGWSYDIAGSTAEREKFEFEATSEDGRKISAGISVENGSASGVVRENGIIKAPVGIDDSLTVGDARKQADAEIAKLMKPVERVEPAPARGEVGASLTKAQRREVLKTLVDVYRQNSAPREMKGIDSNGNERYGYVYSPEYFVRSDITGAMVRYYITLPDGRIAHPTELFPDYTQSDIDAAMQKEIDAERAKEDNDKSRLKTLESRKANTLLEANRKFHKQNMGTVDYVPAILTNGEQFIRTHPDDVDNDLRLLGEGWSGRNPVVERETPSETPQGPSREPTSNAGELPGFEKEVNSYLGEGLYAKSVSELRGLMRFAKVRNVDEFEGIALSDRRKIVEQWLSSKASAVQDGKKSEEEVSQIIKAVARSRPFDDPKAVREDADAAVKEKTGKSIGEHQELSSMSMTDPVYEAIHAGQYEGIRSYAEALPVAISESAIPSDLASRAFSGTSMSPERRGDSARRGYVRDMAGLWRRFERRYNEAAEERKTSFVDAFSEIANRYAGLTNAYLSSHSRVVSSMIAGPSNFPVNRQRKLSDAADNKAKAADEYFRKAPARLMRALRGPLDNSVSAAVSEAESKLAERTAAQARMKLVNAAHARFVKNPSSLDSADLTDQEKKLIREYVPKYSWEPHPFAPYELTNNGAEIRRLTARVEELKRRSAGAAQADEAQADDGAPVRVVRNADAGRLQLFFEEKPSEELRADLKTSGFRWAPSVGAWQRQLTDNAVRDADRIIGRYFDSPDTRYSQQARDPNETLIVQHNLTAKGLLHAFKMGGLAVPSLAITESSRPMLGFGEITLIGPRELADPKGYAGTKVFGADIYSPRYPNVSHFVTSKAFAKLDDDLAPLRELTGAGRIDEDRVTSGGVEGIEDNGAVIAKFLQDRGIKPEIVRIKAKPLPQALEKFGNDPRSKYELITDPDFVDAAWKAHEEVLAELYEDRKAAAEEVASRRATGERRHDFVTPAAADQIVARRQAGNPDPLATREAMRQQIDQAGIQEDFDDYAKEVLRSLNPTEKLFQGHTATGRRYLPHTLDNVIKILKKELRGGENFNYRVGSIRSRFTPQFRSIDQIRSEKGRLVSTEDFAKVKEEINQELSSITEALREYHPAGHSFEFSNSVSFMMSDSARMGIPRALRENGFSEVPQDRQADIATFLNKLRNMPTEYFEAKVLRSVGLSEFSGAVVPEGTRQAVLDALKAHGIQDIRTYSRGVEGSRAEAIRSLAEDLHATGGRTLFSSRGGGGLSKADRAVYEMITEEKPTSEILSFLSKAARTPFQRLLARRLLDLVPDTPIRIGERSDWAAPGSAKAARAGAAYNARTNQAVLFGVHDATRHVLHELVHAATMKAIKAGGLKAARLKRLYLSLKRAGVLEGQYAGTNLDEFIAEAFTNPRFQKLLMDTPAPAATKLRSFWDWLVRAVSTALGIPVSRRTAFAEVMRAGQGVMAENAAARGADGTRYAIAWHGTPHVWPPEPGFPHGRPRLDKIGTGEGAQMYGWGWYSAEAKVVGEEYAKKVKNMDAVRRINQRMSVLSKTMEEDKIPGSWRKYKTNSGEVAAKEYDDLMDERSRIMSAAGNLYQLDIPDDVMPHLLDWDKPLSQQTDVVKNALENDGYDTSEPTSKDDEVMTGEDVIRGLYEVTGDKKVVSEYLNKIGIPGLRYLDRNSRGANTTLGDVVVTKLGKENAAPVKRNPDSIGGYPKYFSNIGSAAAFLEKLNGGINRPSGALGWGVNSTTLKNQADSLAADSKFLTDLIESSAFRSHGLSGIDTPTQRMVLSRVVAVLKNSEILDSVIKSVPVDMVDMLRSKQLAPEMLLHDKSVLFKLNIPVGNNTVSTSVDAASAVIAATARQAAKNILVPFYDAGAFFDIGTTVITGRKHGKLPSGKEHTTDSIYDQLDQARHNFVIWDQPTLDRIALLERNGEKLDAIRAADEAVRFNVADDLPPTITINGVERPTTNSNGKPIHPTLEGVRNFYAWFKDSKVVDEQGRPLILFHGATADFGVDGAPVVFDFGRTADENLSSGKGAYLTTSPEAASRYANGISWGNGGQSDAPNVMPVYARIEAPFSKAATYRVSDFESVLPESVIDSAKEDANPSENFLEETQQAIEDMQRKIFDLQDGYLNNEIAEEYRIEESDYEDSDEYEAAIEDAVESEIASLERSVARYESEIERAWSDAKKDYANTRMTGAEIWDAIKEDLPEYTDWKNERRLIGGDTASIEMDTEVARILFDAFGFDGVKRTDKFPLRTQHAVYIANNSPTQVKSAIGNAGTFDATDPDIRYNVSGDDYSLQFYDANENPVVWSNDDYRVTVNKLGNATLATLWARQVVKGKEFWGKRGHLSTFESTKRLDGKSKDYLRVQEVAIEREHRGNGLSEHLYRALLSQAKPSVSGILIHVPSITNSVQIPRVHLSLGAIEQSDPDFKVIPRSRPSDIRYNLAADWQTAPSRAATTIRQYVAAAMNSDSNTSWLTPFQTQYHKAEKWAKEGKPAFKRLFDRVQQFISDVSRYAITAQEAAPTLMHEIKSAKDVAKALTGGDPFGRQLSADIQAISMPIYEGTLSGGGNPMSGVRWNDERLRTLYQLNDRQIKLYNEALDAIGVSLDEFTKSIIAKHAMQNEVGFNREFGLEDMAADVSSRMKDRIDEIRYQFLSEDAKRAHEAEVEHYLEMDMTDEAKRVKSAFKRKQVSAEKEIARIERTIQDVRALADKADRLKKAGYFPLSRFGRHTVTARDAAGKVQHFSMHGGIPLVPRSGQVEANRVAAAIRQDHPDWKVETGLMNTEKFRLFEGVNPGVLKLFADHLDPGTSEVFQEYLRVATTDNSAMKRLLHRKGTPGFDRDIRRALAQFIVSHARATSANYHNSAMLEAAESAEEDGGDIGAEAIKLYKYVQEPQEEAAALRGFLFFNFLGGSLASATVNAMQVPMMTFPTLSQYESSGKLAARLWRAAKIAVKNPEDIKGPVGEALRLAEMDGVTAPQEIHQMMATAGDNLFAGSRGANYLMRIWGAPFALAESFNRRTTFVAAFEIASEMTPEALKNTGFKTAFEFAEDVVNKTQGIYNKGSRPSIGRGAVGSTMMTFRQFSIMYLELLSRLPRKQQAIMLGVLALAAGGGGLPFAEDIGDILDTIGQWLGYQTNSSRWANEKAGQVLGKPLANLTINGVLSQMGIDLQSRVGAHNLLPGSAILKMSSVDKGRDIQDFFGPAASVVASLGKALENLATGKPDRAALDVAPVAIQNAFKGGAMMVSGHSSDAKGRTGVPVNPVEGFAKLIGFNPKSVADFGSMKRDITQDQRLLQVRREEFTSAIVDAVVAGDQDAKAAAMERWREWNRNHPEARISIDAATIRKRVADIRRTADQRLVRSLPKGLKPQVALQ